MGMLNISPIGRNCSREERNAFEEFDLKNGIRATMVEKMKEEVSTGQHEQQPESAELVKRYSHYNTLYDF
jgi:hypothetical protein